jgi:hypothetical protein
MKWDLFISHASNDKESFVLPLYKELKKRKIRVWLDSENIELGDSIRHKIEMGLSRSRYAIVLISPHFIERPWPLNELDSLFARESVSSKVILPVLHEIGYDEVKNKLPLMAGKLSMSSSLGVKKVADAIMKVVQQDNSSVDQLYKLSYIDFSISPDNISIRVCFSEFQAPINYDLKIYLDISKRIADIIRTIVARIYETDMASLVLSRPTEHAYDPPADGGTTSISYYFSILRLKPISIRHKWISILFFLHLRDWHYFYKISENYLAFYATMYNMSNGVDYVEDTSSDEAQQYLAALKPYFEEQICKIINIEPGLNARKVILADPVYESEAVPFSGMNAFEFRGIVVE